MSGLRDLQIPPDIMLPARLLEVRVSRSSGPGGQNVNKVSTKVDVRLDLGNASEILDSSQIERIREKLSTRIDRDGRLQVVCDTHRDQVRNLETALQRLERLVETALTEPRERRPTAPSPGVHRHRIKDKRIRGQVKRLRSSPGSDD